MAPWNEAVLLLDDQAPRQCCLDIIAAVFLRCMTMDQLGRQEDDSLPGGIRDSPLVSVVIPVFNGLAYLEQTLDTVFSQDYPSVQIVLVDGGSRDGSAQYIKKLQQHASVLIDCLPAGTPAALTWSHACSLASGEFIKIMGQDDLLAPSLLTRQASILIQNSTAGIVSGPRSIISSDNRLLVSRRGLSGLRSGMNSGMFALRACFLAGTNVIGEPFAVMFRRDALMPALPWSDKRPLLLDLDMYSKVLQSWDFYADHCVTGSFRISSTSLSFKTVETHYQQFRQWQYEFLTVSHSISLYERLRARLAAALQVLQRRIAYVLMVRTSNQVIPCSAYRQ